MHEPPQFSRSFPANAAIVQYSRVKLLSTGKIDVAGLTDRGIGIAMRPAFTADVTAETPIPVALDGPIRKAIANEALAIGADLFSEASGQVQDTSTATAFRIGIALEAATAQNDVIDYVALQSGAAV